VHTGLAFAGEADAIAFVDAGGNLHRQGLVRLLAARAVAVGAGRGNELAGAVALGAGLLDGEEALLHAHLAMTVTGRAGLDLGALLGAAAVAGCAFLHGRDADLGLGAACGFLERDLEVVAQVGAAVDIAASAATAGATAEDVAEDVGEGIGETARATAEAAAHAGLRIDPGVAVLVVGGALLGIGQDLVGLLGLLELFLGLRIVRIAVRVVLH